MKISEKFILIALVTILVACDKNDDVFVDPDNKLIGTWIYQSSTDDYQRIYKRVNLLENEQYGFVFKSKNEFLNRSSASWCGTPPTYADYEGKWSEKDAIINISVGYWGGTIKQKWQVISVDDKTLVIHELEVDYIEQ